MLSRGVQLSGRYRLDERIAGGGMGDVWRGTDEVLGRTVAVKILLPALLAEPGFAERFHGEARTMANINHPGVVDVYDYGSDDEVAYLVMEYVEGDALSTTLGRVGRLTPARTMALVAQAADALQAAHQKGIVHRDVKPGNLLVRPNGTLVLTDFGIARSALVGHLTVAGSVLGTASYISPEQAAGGVATPASDVYALGVVAYQCLSGHRPFEGDNPVEIALRHVREVPPRLPADIPPAVTAIVERAMAKDPPARWSSAAQLAAVARQAAATLGASPAGAGGFPHHATSPARAGAPAPPARAGAPASARAGAPASPARPVTPTPAGRSFSPPARTPTPPGHPASPPVRAPVAPVAARFTPAYPAPASPPARGGYARGAAAVGPGQSRPVHQGAGYAPLAPQVARTAAPRRSGVRTGVIVLAVLVAALAIMICAGTLAYLAHRRNTPDSYDRGAGRGADGTSDITCGQGQSQKYCGQYQNQKYCGQYQSQKYQEVRAELRHAGYRVVRVDVPGPDQGRVVGLTTRVTCTDETTEGRQTR